MAVTTAAPGIDVKEGPYPYRWTVDTYEQLIETGQLDHVRTELIEGVIYVKWKRGEVEIGQGNSHITAIRLVVQALRELFGPDFDVNAQLPLPLTDESAPEPDVLVLRGRASDFDGREPHPQKDVALLVEVSDTTLKQDQTIKVRLYATHGIPEYWIVNLRDRTLEIRRQPQPGSGFYAETLVLLEDKSLPLGDGSVRVVDLLPKTSQE